MTEAVIELSENYYDLISKTLMQPQVRPDDNFFALGGHSLLAVELLNEIEKKFSVRMMMKDIVESESFHELWLKINAKSSSPKPSQINITQNDYFKLTQTQSQIWKHCILYPHSAVHHISNAIRIKKPLDENTVEKTLNHLLEKHEVLRTRFKTINGEPYQYIVPFKPSKPEIDSLEEENILPTIENLIEVPFSLEREPLIRIKFFKINEEDHIFFVMVHHIIMDGISNTIFFHDFNSVYNSYLSGETPEQKSESLPFYRYSQLELEYQAADEYKEQEQEWRRLYQNAPPVIQLPSDFKRTEHSKQTASSIFFEIDDNRLKKLEVYSAQKHTSLFTVVFSVYNLLISKLSGENDVVVGIPVHGRHLPETRNSLGCFINTLPVRSFLHTDKSLKHNLSSVAASLKYAFLNQSVSLENILKMANFESRPGFSPLFQTLFIYLDVSKEMEVFSELKYEHIKLSRKSVHTDLDFYLFKSSSKIEGVLEYRSDLFLPETMDSIKEQFIDLLDAMLTDDDLVINNTFDFKSRVTKEKMKSDLEISLSSLPVTQTQQTLFDIWANVLDSRNFDINSNFFSIGGHSLMAVEIFNQIKNHFHIQMPIATFFEAGTIIELASIVDKQKQDQEGRTRIFDKKNLKSIVKIKDESNDEIFFCFHGVGGNILNYYPLAQHTSNKALYGIQSVFNDDGTLLNSSIPEMASYYVSEIRKIQLNGPYILGGGSMGGLIALEAATQLKNQGETIKSLIMFDTYGPDLPALKIEKSRWTIFLAKVCDIYQNFKSLYGKVLQRKLSHQILYKQVEKYNRKALNIYMPPKWEGNLVLIRSRAGHEGPYSDPTLGWRNTILGSIEIIEVEGEHGTLIENPTFQQAFALLMKKL